MCCTPGVAPACIEAEGTRREKSRLLEREQAWRRVCPPEYATGDPAKLPSPEARCGYELALSWSPDQGGLSFVGRAIGQGKSRLAHAAARRHFLAGTSVAMVNCAALGLEVACRFDRELRAWLRPLQAAGILILDDLGKEPTDRRGAWVLYHLVEHRTAHGKPILFTTNHTGDELASRLGEQGPYLVRRLREFCRTCLL